MTIRSVHYYFVPLRSVYTATLVHTNNRKTMSIRRRAKSCCLLLQQLCITSWHDWVCQRVMAIVRSISVIAIRNRLRHDCRSRSIRIYCSGAFFMPFRRGDSGIREDIPGYDGKVREGYFKSPLPSKNIVYFCIVEIDRRCSLTC